MKTAKILMAIAIAIGLTACNSKDSLKKTLEQNPDILVNAIEKNPAQIMEALNNAVRKAQQQQAEDREKGLGKEREEEFKNPKVAQIDESRIWGNKSAPITIVAYSDFECPFCSRGYTVLEEVKKKYGDKVRIVFKNLPLDFHPLAMPAAKYLEATMKQGAEKAEKFHDYVFQNQKELGTKKVKFLEEAAKKAGADLAQVKKDMESEEVKQTIAQHMEEAKKFQFNGTPGFLINGVSIRGAYPAEEFAKIIDQHLGASKQ